MKSDPDPLRSAQPLEIAIMPDAMGAEMLRQIADAIEAHVDKENDAGGIVELPVAMPNRLAPESIADLADAIDATGALDEPDAHGLDFETVWTVTETFLHFGAATRPPDLMDILIDLGSNMTEADEARLRENINAWLARHEAGYEIAEDDQGGYSVARVASGPRPRPAFKFKRLRFSNLATKPESRQSMEVDYPKLGTGFTFVKCFRSASMISGRWLTTRQ